MRLYLVVWFKSTSISIADKILHNSELVQSHQQQHLHNGSIDDHLELFNWFKVCVKLGYLKNSAKQCIRYLCVMNRAFVSTHYIMISISINKQRNSDESKTDVAANQLITFDHKTIAI